MSLVQQVEYDIVITDALTTTQATGVVTLDPDDYVGVVPPGVELETYPRGNSTR